MAISALAMAMLLTGAGMAAAQSVPAPRSIPVPPPILYAPPPPAPPPPVPPRRARANLNSYFTADDCPAAALRAEEEGTVGFRLTVGTDGRVSRCEITAPSGAASLDAATCAILAARARYAPARDGYGRPVPGLDSGRVTWRLPLEVEEEWRAGVPLPAQSAWRLTMPRTLIGPADYPEAAFRARESGTSLLIVVIGREGRPVACEVHESSGSALLDAAACRLVGARARYGPALGADGSPVCDVDMVPVVWTLPAARPAWAGPGQTDAAVPVALELQLNAGTCPGWTGAPPPAIPIRPGRKAQPS